MVPKFTLTFLLLYFGLIIDVVKRNHQHQCDQVLRKRRFIFTTLTNNYKQKICYDYGYLKYYQQLC